MDTNMSGGRCWYLWTVIHPCWGVETPDMLSGWQTAKEWLYKLWVASERLVLYSVNDGAARERPHKERVAEE